MRIFYNNYPLSPSQSVELHDLFGIATTLQEEIEVVAFCLKLVVFLFVEAI